MIMVSSDRFHRAARDGFLDLLREANRKDCNTQDEDGMTPTLLAAACGNLDTLRLIVGRGGDPDKCDWYGSTALHCAAANGHMNCVSFLVNFGSNIWALDNEYHTPKEVAGIKSNEEILRFLDDEMTKQTKLNKKNVMSLKEKAIRDADKRVKEFEKLQTKAQKKAAKEEKKLQKEREKMGKNGGTAINDIQKGPLGLPALTNDSKALYISPKYSDIVNNSASKKTLSGITKKIQQQKLRSPNSRTQGAQGDFKVREIESNGHRSVRSLSGLRRDSEVLYVTKLDDNVDGVLMTGHSLTRSLSAHHLFDENGTGGMFERPGFGNVAFRNNSLTGAMLSSLSMEFGNIRKRPSLNGIMADDGVDDAELGSAGEESVAGDSIGSAGSLAVRNQRSKWMNFGGDDVKGASSATALETFLTAHDLMACFPYLVREQIDLKALVLLNEDDLKEIGIPMGIRKKMMDAIRRRKDVFNDAGEVYDSKL